MWNHAKIIQLFVYGYLGMTGVRLATVLCLLLHGASGVSTSLPSTHSRSSDPFGIVLFIVLPLCLSLMCLWTSRSFKMRTVDSFGLLNRSLNLVDSSVIMICVWVCGGYMFSSAESVVSEGQGLAWTQAPWCYSLSFLIASLLFCNNLRGKGYLTYMNAFSELYTEWIAAFLYIPAFIGEVSWLAVSLSTLGQAFQTLLGVSRVFSMSYILIMVLINIISGGMLSLKRTCRVEMTVMSLSFLLTIICIASNSQVGHIGDYSSQWLGSIARSDIGEWIDVTLMLTLGGACWQTYYQIGLACNSVETAGSMSIVSGIGTLLCGAIACFCGIAATAVDWSQFPEVGTLQGNESNIMSFVLKYLIPTPVRYVAILATTALTSSSIAGAVFSSSTTFAINVYKGLLRPQARDSEVITVWRIWMVVVGGVGIGLALSTRITYSIWVFSSDFIYVIIFPQLLLAVWLAAYANLYGSLSALLVGGVLRLGAGETLLGLRRWIAYPVWLPYRLTAVIVSIGVGLAVSVLSRYLMETKGMEKLDVLRVYHAKPTSGRWSRKRSRKFSKSVHRK